MFPLSFFVLTNTKLFKHQRIYNYFASCCQTPNFPIPIDLLLQVTHGHAQLAYKIHKALSDFERLLLIVNFQSHKDYSEDLPRFLNSSLCNATLTTAIKQFGRLSEVQFPTTPVHFVAELFEKISDTKHWLNGLC